MLLLLRVLPLTRALLVHYNHILLMLPLSTRTAAADSARLERDAAAAALQRVGP